MSSNSYSGSCPVCQGSLNINSDNRPFERVDTNCMNCWFYSYTKTGRSTLEEVIDQKNEDLEDTFHDVAETITEYNRYSETDFNI